MPETAFAFSADSIWRATEYSRAVNALDFTDPVWLRLGFVNELRYNWTTGPTCIARPATGASGWGGIAGISPCRGSK